MPFLDTNHQRASFLILLLGAGLVFALAPHSTGLVGGLVLYVAFAPVHQWLCRRLSIAAASGIVVVLVLVLLVAPGISLISLIVDQAQQMATSVMKSTLFARLAVLRVGEFSVGPQLASASEKLVTWLENSAVGLLGTAARLAINLTIALFCLYYLLLSPAKHWESVRPYIPFSAANADKLRLRFRDVTTSTIIGIGVNALVQGSYVGLAFTLAGIPNGVFWGVVAAVFAILPVVGTAVIWGPGVLSLFIDGRYGAGAGVLIGALLVAGAVDFALRPWVFRRFAQIHPLVTLVGAVGGVGYFGILGILIGPLALSYFFELIAMYREEYLTPDLQPVSPEASTPSGTQ